MRAGILTLGRPLRLGAPRPETALQRSVHWVSAALSYTEEASGLASGTRNTSPWGERPIPSPGGGGEWGQQDLQLFLGYCARGPWDPSPKSLQDSHSAPYLTPTASSHERNGFRVSVCYPKANLQLCMVGETCPYPNIVYLDRGTKEEEEGFPPHHPVFDLKCSPHASPPL